MTVADSEAPPIRPKITIPVARLELDAEHHEAVAAVLSSGQLASGPEVARFETEFSAAVGAAHGVATSNGTVAIELGLRAAGIGPGDEVIVPSFTFIASASAIVAAGATPVFADIEPDTFCLSARTVAPHLSDRTAAILAVHLFGLPAPMFELRKLCDERGLALFEDAAQAHGASIDEHRVGSLGDFATFSFYATKNLAAGEGGMITTNDPELAARARSLGNHGRTQGYFHDRVGTNARMSDLHAAIARVELRRLADGNRRRRLHAAWYDEQLPTSLIRPSCPAGSTHVYHQYTVRTDDRATVTAALDRASVGWAIVYPVPCHLQQAFAPSRMSLPESEKAAAEVLSIPVRPGLSSHELEHVAGALRGVLS